jgi:hypothetical protein
MCGGHHRDRQSYVARERNEPRVAQERPDVRASDVDRQRYVDQLRTHAADGRLTLDEFETRVEQAFAATTHGELRAVVADLPAPPRERTRIDRHRGLVLPRPAVIIALVVLISVLIGHFAWWLIPVAFWITRGWGYRHHRSGPRDGAGRDDALTFT